MKKSLPLKLYTGLFVAIGLVLAVGYVSISALNRQQAESLLVIHANKVVSQVRDIRNSLSQMRDGRRAFWVTGDPKFLDSYAKGIAVMPNSVQQLKELVAENPEQVLNVIRLDSLLIAIFRFWSNDGKIDPTQSREMYKVDVLREEAILDKVYAQFEIIKVEEEHLLIKREKMVAQYNTRTKNDIIIGMCVLMIVVLLLINSVVLTLKSRYRSGRKLEESLAQMEKINVRAEEKNWVLEGMSYVNNRLQVVDSISVLADRIITSVVQYLEVPAGVLYYVDESKQHLVTAASVAVSAGSDKTFLIGEGIVGNAALSKTAVIIKHIPPDYWKVDSGLGKVTGNGEIFCLPLWMDDELKGLIELGCFESFTELQKALLNSIADILSAAINSHQARQKIDSLLMELQEKKTVLENQQEELRQTNEELSRQAEELQASEEELKTQEEELKQINIELKERNMLIEEARHSLDVKAKELENTSRYKSEFLANMSHELRTPLNSILILAKLLADNGGSNLTKKQTEYATIIHKSGKDLLELINDILDLSKIEAGKVDLSIEEVSLQHMQEDISQLFAVVASDKKINFHIEISPDAPASIQTDKQRLEQIIRNLLSNAFKFTPKDGTITVSFSNRNQFNESFLSISVSDTGIGINDEKQQLIFEAFQQADGSTSRKYGGTGLGLSISKELARLLGGKIELFSAEGKGSTFTILLPHDHQSVPAKTEMEEPQTELPSIKAVPAQTLVSDDRDTIGAGERSMLIIEDDVNFATIIRDFARDKGYKAIVALQGDEGLYYAQQYLPAAIILDIQLPVIDGWTLLKKFRSDDILKNIPVHIISAFDDNRLKHAGVLAYLKKPVDAAGLENVFNVLGNHIQTDIKKVLIVSEPDFKEEALYRLFRAKHHEVVFDRIHFSDAVEQKTKTEVYDCIIVHIGNATGISQVQEVKRQLAGQSTPLIIHLDEDITADEELQLKKSADTIIRSSLPENSRMIDELELFLYKMEKNSDQKSESEQPLAIVNDASLAGKRILLVDDDMRNLFAVSAVLEASKMKVVTASDGKEALKELKANPNIDLVLMDIMMPEMDGYEAMQHIRHTMKLMSLPIIALTAKAMAGDRDKCIASGASDYITKPVDMQKLFSLMRVWLNK